MKLIYMKTIEILEAERLIKSVLNRNFIDDFCRGKDLGLTLDLTIQNLTSGYHNALRKLGVDFDDDKITSEQYIQAQQALTSLYNYYKQTINNNVNTFNNDSIRGEEFIDLPDFLGVGSPEEHIYIKMYRKYGIDKATPEEKEFFEHQFYEQFFDSRYQVEQCEKVEGKPRYF